MTLTNSYNNTAYATLLRYRAITWSLLIYRVSLLGGAGGVRGVGKIFRGSLLLVVVPTLNRSDLTGRELQPLNF